MITYTANITTHWVRNISSPSERPGEVFIGGGATQTICAGSTSAGIFSGDHNMVCENSTLSVIAGGQANIIGLNGAAGHGVIGGGYANHIVGSAYPAQANSNVIAGGHLNRIIMSSCSFIGGGGGLPAVANRIQAGDYSSVVGGHNNYINGANYASILGGSNNTVSGNYSSIFGGSGNNDMGFAFAGIFGQNVNAVAPNTFHVECLNAVNTPAASAGFPSGTVMWKSCAALTATDRVLVIHP